MIFIVDLNRDLNHWFKSCQPCCTSVSEALPTTALILCRS